MIYLCLFPWEGHPVSQARERAAVGRVGGGGLKWQWQGVRSSLSAGLAECSPLLPPPPRHPLVLQSGTKTEITLTMLPLPPPASSGAHLHLSTSSRRSLGLSFLNCRLQPHTVVVKILATEKGF